MNKRIEALTSLKEYVEARKNTRSIYVEQEHNGETCYCAIGYLGKQYGLSDDQLRQGRRSRISSPDVKLIADALLVDFHYSELMQLQSRNDISPHSLMFLGNESEYVKEIVDYIDELILNTP